MRRNRLGLLLILTVRLAAAPAATAQSPAQRTYTGTAKELITLRPDLHGWERFGRDHRELTKPFMEGAWMTKHGGKYYLQYAAPGTEYNVYANGTYVGDSDARNAFVSWKEVPGAVGYNVLWGIRPDKLYQTYQVFADQGTQVEIRALSLGQGYSFAVEAFNEAGVSKPSEVKVVPST